MSFSVDGHHSFGLAVDGADGATGVVDVGARLDDVADLSDLIVQQRLDEVRSLCDPAVVDRSIDDVTFELTVPRPGKIFCNGVNYGGRNAEYRDGQDGPSRPSVFVRFPSSDVGEYWPLVRP